ncbi:short chain dehydrogenase [Gracilaria domingensis]|nr:short chain dehydrogenase [Gracilaria domingensis]
MPQPREVAAAVRRNQRRRRRVRRKGVAHPAGHHRPRLHRHLCRGLCRRARQPRRAAAQRRHHDGQLPHRADAQRGASADGVAHGVQRCRPFLPRAQVAPRYSQHTGRARHHRVVHRRRPHQGHQQHRLRRLPRQGLQQVRQDWRVRAEQAGRSTAGARAGQTPQGGRHQRVCHRLASGLLAHAAAITRRVHVAALSLLRAQYAGHAGGGRCVGARPRRHHGQAADPGERVLWTGRHDGVGWRAGRECEDVQAGQG